MVSRVCEAFASVMGWYFCSTAAASVAPNAVVRPWSSCAAVVMFSCDDDDPPRSGSVARSMNSPNSYRLVPAMTCALVLNLPAAIRFAGVSGRTPPAPSTVGVKGGPRRLPSSALTGDVGIWPAAGSQAMTSEALLPRRHARSPAPASAPTVAAAPPSAAPPSSPSPQSDDANASPTVYACDWL